MSELELQNKALNNKIRRLKYRLQIYRGIAALGTASAL